MLWLDWVITVLLVINVWASWVRISMLKKQQDEIDALRASVRFLTEMIGAKYVEPRP